MIDVGPLYRPPPPPNPPTPHLLPTYRSGQSLRTSPRLPSAQPRVGRLGSGRSEVDDLGLRVLRVQGLGTRNT